uniref:AlNc14C96G5885 protein n=1 Tax=Albugo laibachii Nc14 TaxID=890382 RepID=F0WH10_9STRA|nr:AlNc14C96G5885 [Albugo laibachii Nc14]|eukprot:CCA20525.1 AlNc14C96G5885 [Albugo laibachii Nc14]
MNSGNSIETVETNSIRKDKDTFIQVSILNTNQQSGCGKITSKTHVICKIWLQSLFVAMETISAVRASGCRIGYRALHSFNWGCIRACDCCDANGKEKSCVHWTEWKS